MSGFWVGFCCRPVPPVPPLYVISLFFQFFTYKEGFGFVFCGGALALPLPVVLVFQSRGW